MGSLVLVISNIVFAFFTIILAVDLMWYILPALFHRPSLFSVLNPIWLFFHMMSDNKVFEFHVSHVYARETGNDQIV